MGRHGPIHQHWTRVGVAVYWLTTLTFSTASHRPRSLVSSPAQVCAGAAGAKQRQPLSATRHASHVTIVITVGVIGELTTDPGCLLD
jgi:hypothetical protein